MWRVIGISAALLIMTLGAVLEAGPRTCSGWDCEEVICPKGYAVYVTEEKKYLPCEDFNFYTQAVNDEVARTVLR